MGDLLSAGIRSSYRHARDRPVETADALVSAHRFTIAAAFPVVGAVALIASARGLLPVPLAFNPLLLLAGTLVMRTPLVVALAPLVRRRGVALLAGLTGYAYAIEYVGVTTGWPYGRFHYGVDLGPMVAGVPVGLPVFFLPLVLNASLLSVLLVGDRFGRIGRAAVALAFVLVVDLALDPAAVALGFWSYVGGGIYYGVPLSNFAGWLLSGTVAVVAVELAFDNHTLRNRLADCPFALDDLVSFVVLWGTVDVVSGNWLAAGATAVLLAGLVRSNRFTVVVSDHVRTLADGFRTR